jgi:hypothetical protein
MKRASSRLVLLSKGDQLQLLLPRLGTYGHYPVHVCKMGRVIGFGQATRVNVVQKVRVLSV